MPSMHAIFSLFALRKKSDNDIKFRFNFNATSNVSKRFQLVEKCTLLTIHFHYQLYKYSMNDSFVNAVVNEANCS